MYVCACIHVIVYMHVCVRVCACVHVCVCVCMCGYYVYIVRRALFSFCSNERIFYIYISMRKYIILLLVTVDLIRKSQFINRQ